MKFKFDEEFKGVVCEPSNVEECLQMIIDIGFDYDGFNDSKNLKSLIDELVGYAEKGMKFICQKKFIMENTEKEDNESFKRAMKKKERFEKNESLRNSSI